MMKTELEKDSQPQPLAIGSGLGDLTTDDSEVELSVNCTDKVTGKTIDLGVAVEALMCRGWVPCKHNLGPPNSPGTVMHGIYSRAPWFFRRSNANTPSAASFALAVVQAVKFESNLNAKATTEAERARDSFVDDLYDNVG